MKHSALVLERSDPYVPELVVQHWSSHKAARTYHVLAGVVQSAVPVAFDNCVVNVAEAVEKRVLRYWDKTKQALQDVLKPIPGAFSEIEPLRSRMVWLLFNDGLDPPRKLSGREFVDGCRPHLRRRYEAAWQKYLSRGITAADARVRVFAKWEKLEEGAVPRVVSPRSPVYNLCLGRYLRPLEHRVYAACSALAGEVVDASAPVIAKGLTQEGKGTALLDKWGRFKRPVAFCLDASKFDQHVSIEALRLEHKSYNECYHHDRSLRWLLTQQERSKCSGFFKDGTLKYEIDGTRMSGDVNTSLGNCQLSCLMVLGFLQSRGIGHAEVLVDGDDVVVMVEEERACEFANLKAYYQNLGFRMKLSEPIVVFEQIEFCSANPMLLDATHAVLVRPLKKLINDLTTMSAPNADRARDWIAATGVAGSVAFGDVPIWGALYSSMRAVGSAKRAMSTTQWKRGWEYDRCGQEGARERRVGNEAETRASFFRLSGIAPSDQLILEQELSKPLAFKPIERVTFGQVVTASDPAG